jgi:chloride channel protein, CIC family
LQESPDAAAGEVRPAGRILGRVPIVEPSTMRLVGLVSRKDLLRIRRTARAAEETGASYFGKMLGEERQADAQVVSAED